MTATTNVVRKKNSVCFVRHAAALCLLAIAAGCDAPEASSQASSAAPRPSSIVSVEDLTPEVIEALAKIGINAAVLTVVSPSGEPFRVLRDPARTRIEEVTLEEPIRLDGMRLPNSDTDTIVIWRGSDNTTVCPRPHGGGATSCRNITTN